MSESKHYEELSNNFISKLPSKTSKSRWFVYNGDFFNRVSEDYSFNAPEGFQFDRFFGYLHPEEYIQVERLKDGRILVAVLDEDNEVTNTYVGVYDRE